MRDDAFNSYLTSGNQPEKPVRLFSSLASFFHPLTSPLPFSPPLYPSRFISRFTLSTRVRAVSRRFSRVVERTARA